MIRYTSQNQIMIEEFKTPFEIKLPRENRWVKLAEALAWDELAKIYYRAMSATKGRISVDARMVFGAMIIKHKEELSDEGTLESMIFLVMNLPLVLKSAGSSFLSFFVFELDRLFEFLSRCKMATRRVSRRVMQRRKIFLILYCSANIIYAASLFDEKTHYIL